jgi:hypothetical protein
MRDWVQDAIGCVCLFGAFYIWLHLPLVLQ